MRRPEQELQRQVFAYIRQAYPKLIAFHVPNATGNRGPRLGGILKSIGVVAGVPDIVVVLPDARAAFIELKAGKGKLTEAQSAFRDRAQQLECPWAEVRSLTEAAELLHSWLLPYGLVSKARIAA